MFIFASPEKKEQKKTHHGPWRNVADPIYPLAAPRRWQGPALPGAIVLVPTRELCEQARNWRVGALCTTLVPLSSAKLGGFAWVIFVKSAESSRFQEHDLARLAEQASETMLTEPNKKEEDYTL